MTERIYITIALIALCAVIFIKEQATFLLGSLIFGVLFLVLAERCGELAAKSGSDIFMRWLHIAEALISAVLGVAFLIIPQYYVSSFAIAIGSVLIADGVVRIGKVLYPFFMRLIKKY